MSNVDIPENFKNFAGNDALIADMLEENPALALQIERDYTAEIFKMKQASVGYTIGQDGRAKEINTRISDVQTELPSQTTGSDTNAEKTKEAKENFAIAERLIEVEKSLPKPPTSIFVDGVITDEGQQFRDKLAKIIGESNGRLKSFLVSEVTNKVTAIVKYPNEPEMEIREDEFKNLELLKAKIQKATGAGSNLQQEYYNRFKDRQ